MKSNLLFFLLIISSFVSNAQCEKFAMTINTTNPTCYNFSDGSCTVNTIAGNGTKYYTMTNSEGTIMNWANTQEINTLVGGWYYWYVIDDMGCELYDSAFLVNPPEMIAYSLYTPPTNTGSCDGVIEIDTVLNYQGDYSNIGYFWGSSGPNGLGQTTKSDLCDDYYELVINDEFGCSIVNDFAVGSVSITTNQNDEKITVFPNPTNNNQTLNIELNQSTIVAIQLIDINGKLIQEIFSGELGDTNSNFHISFDELPNGIYFYTITLENGVVYREKTIKN